MDIKVGMKICVQAGLGINYLVVEEVGDDYFIARFLTGTKHQIKRPLNEYGTEFLDASD